MERPGIGLAVVSVLSVATVACGGERLESGAWLGTERDSAGVTIVSNPDQQIWPSGSGWQLEEMLRIGSVDGEPIELFGRVAGVAVDSGGNVYVLDRSAGEIRVFDPSGTFSRRIGRSGSGPGELTAPSALLLSGDTLFVPDSPNQRVQRYTTDGTDAGAFRLSLTDGVALEWGTTASGALLALVRTIPTASGGRERNLVLARDGSGAVLDTIVEMDVGRAMEIRDGRPFMTMFAAEPMWTPLSDGRVATGLNSEYSLRAWSLGGELERIIRKPFEPVPFPESHHRQVGQLFDRFSQARGPSEGTAAMLETMEYAADYPAYAGMFGGPRGSLWVRRALTVPELEVDDMEDFNVRAMGSGTWDVFDSAGRHLGPITTPRSFIPLVSVADAVYGLVRDELGVQYVVGLRVVR